jgi:subtilisin family serine protease
LKLPKKITMPNQTQQNLDLTVPEKPFQLPGLELAVLLTQASSFIRVNEARNQFNVSGKNYNVAVIDTGINPNHVDFTGRIITQKNFTADNNANPNDATDGHGHGTNVSGIAVANGVHIGIAPQAGIIPIKTFANDGGSNTVILTNALQWVLDNYKKYNISVVNLSLGAKGSNLTHENDYLNEPVTQIIKKLAQKRVVCVIAAGNSFFDLQSKQGMGYPAIIKECISVGAVYDSGGMVYKIGGTEAKSGPGRITPFSQRLHESINKAHRTDIFAPGAPITSSGIKTPQSSSTQSGTSQATPVVAGMVLLLQDFYGQIAKAANNQGIFTNPLPSVNLLISCLRGGGVVINDGDDEVDNVQNTGLNFIRLDAVGALTAMQNRFAMFFSSNRDFQSSEDCITERGGVKTNCNFDYTYLLDDEVEQN